MVGVGIRALSSLPFPRLFIPFPVKMVAIDDYDSVLEKDAAVIDQPVGEDDDLPPAVAAKRRIRYFDDEEDNNGASGPSTHDMGYPLRRVNSTFSIHSLSSVRSGQRVIDPAIALPVQYRTLSYNISSQQDQAVTQTKDAREKAAIGEFPQSYPPAFAQPRQMLGASTGT